MIKHTSEKVQAYVYFGKHRITGEFYIGYREANIKLNVTSDVDLLKYRTSSKKVHSKFDEFHWVIVAEFNSGIDAYDFEQQLIFEHWENPLLLNECCHYQAKARWKSPGFDHINSNKEYYNKQILTWWESLPQQEKAILNAKRSQPGKLNGMYGRDRRGPLGPNFGIPLSAAHKKQISERNSGMVGVKDAITGEVVGQVSVTDPRYLSGQLVHCALGNHHTEEFKKKRSEEWKLRGIRPPSPKGKIWWNNGISHFRGPKSPREGWVRGKLKIAK